MTSRPLNLGEGPLLPLLLKMSWPSMIAMLALALYNLWDAFWLARLSPHSLAAFTVTLPITMAFAAIGVGTGVGAGSYAARMFGAGCLSHARRTAGQALVLSAGMGGLMILPTLLWPEAMLHAFGATDAMMDEARHYLVIAVFGAPFLIFMMIVNNLLRAEGRPTGSMMTIFIFSLVSAALDPPLIFGAGPVPPLGIAGAAYAAVIGQAAAALVAAYLMIRPNSRYRLDGSLLKPEWAIIRGIYATGLPSVLMNLVFSIVVIAYNHALAPYGPLALASLSLCFRINGLVAMVLFGIGHGVMPLVGFNAGAKNYERLLATIRLAERLAAVLAGASALLILLFAHPILSVFTEDPALIAMAVPALRIFVAMLVLAGPSLIWINLFIGLGKGTTAMVLLFVRDILVLLPCLFFFSRVWGITGVWLANPVSTALTFLAIGYWAFREIRQIRRLGNDHSGRETT